MAELLCMRQGKPTYEELEAKVESLERLVYLLMEEVKELKAKLAEKNAGKNSSNSSIPPSKDENRPRTNRSLREKSGKTSGGQPGHAGHYLPMTQTPDRTIIHVPGICNQCGRDISMFAPVLTGLRQVVDIPPVKPVYIQHETYSRRCACGCICEGAFPASVTAPVQYGPGVESLTAYLSVRQYMPYRRICEFFSNVFGIGISEGSVNNMLQRFTAKADVVYQLIKDQISQARVVGADETGMRVNGSKGWIWSWQDPLNTFLVASQNRGKKTIESVFAQGLPNAVLLSDAWASHLSMPCRGHQLCVVHMQRELKFFTEVHPADSWPKRLKALFKKAVRLKAELKSNAEKYWYRRHCLHEELEELLKVPPRSKSKKLRAFYNRLVKNRASLLKFLDEEDVPPDNNQTEKSIRNAKVKLKVSGMFKSFKGAEIFVTIRSVVDTFIKRKIDPLKAFTLITS